MHLKPEKRSETGEEQKAATGEIRDYIADCERASEMRKSFIFLSAERSRGTETKIEEKARGNEIRYFGRMPPPPPPQEMQKRGARIWWKTIHDGKI